MHSLHVARQSSLNGQLLHVDVGTVEGCELRRVVFDRRRLDAVRVDQARNLSTQQRYGRLSMSPRLGTLPFTLIGSSVSIARMMYEPYSWVRCGEMSVAVRRLLQTAQAVAQVPSGPKSNQWSALVHKARHKLLDHPRALAEVRHVFHWRGRSTPVTKYSKCSISSTRTGLLPTSLCPYVSVPILRGTGHPCRGGTAGRTPGGLMPAHRNG